MNCAWEACSKAIGSRYKYSNAVHTDMNTTMLPHPVEAYVLFTSSDNQIIAHLICDRYRLQCTPHLLSAPMAERAGCPDAAADNDEINFDFERREEYGERDASDSHMGHGGALVNLVSAIVTRTRQ